MFRAWCSKRGREALIWASSVEGISNTDQGIILSYTCVCGDHAEMHTGAASTGTSTVHPG